MEGFNTVCWIILFVFCVLTGDMEGSKTLKALRGEKRTTQRQRRMVDGGDLPPLPIRRSGDDQGTQQIPNFEPETRHFNVESQSNIPTRYDTGPSENNPYRSAAESSTRSPNRNPNTGYRYYTTGSPSSTDPYNTNRVQYQYYNTGNDPRYNRDRYTQYYATRTGNQDATNYDGSRTTYTQYYPNSQSRTVYTTRTRNTYPDDSRFTSGYEYSYRPNTQADRGTGYAQGGPVYGGTSSYIPNTGVVSNDPNCPSDNFRVLINGLECRQAVDSIGRFICYQYERVSTECCQKCLTVKTPQDRNCEYGDRSNQCRNIQPFDCYDDRTRDICCDMCKTYRRQMDTGIASCEYGDLTPRCTFVNQQRQLCYLPENQRLCCVTCPRLADQSNPNCKWGDQNPQLCNPFSSTGSLRINCYQNSVQQVCCSTCDRLRSRYTDAPAGCEFGDRPVAITTSLGVFDCSNYVRNFGLEVCDSQDINRHCCYTCHRYRQVTRSSQGQGQG